LLKMSLFKGRVTLSRLLLFPFGMLDDVEQRLSWIGGDV